MTQHTIHSLIHSSILMDHCLSLKASPPSLPGHSRSRRSTRKLMIHASGGKKNDCGFSNSGLNTPLEPVSSEGRFLSGVLQDGFECFHAAAKDEVQKLAAARHEAAARLSLSFGSHEAALHRRIAELRKRECQIAIEDVMYMLVLYKFKDIGVHLVPRLSRCMYNGRLEIWPCKDWELESIHSFQVLEMVKEHLTSVIGWRADSNVTANWARTKLPRSHLRRIYTSSILYGYFLKSASLRHLLDLTLGLTYHMQFSCEQNGIPLSCYILGLNPEMLQICAKPKTKEAVDLIEKHSRALFGDEKTGKVEMNEVITTSISSLKRMVLEAVAFGSFLWETEEFVSSLYKLKEN